MLLIAQRAWLSFESAPPQLGGPDPVGSAIDPDVSRISTTYGFTALPGAACVLTDHRTPSEAAPSHAKSLRMSAIVKTGAARWLELVGKFGGLTRHLPSRDLPTTLSARIGLTPSKIGKTCASATYRLIGYSSAYPQPPWRSWPSCVTSTATSHENSFAIAAMGAASRSSPSIARAAAEVLARAAMRREANR